jgi:hypothetical protein
VLHVKEIINFFLHETSREMEVDDTIENVAFPSEYDVKMETGTEDFLELLVIPFNTEYSLENFQEEFEGLKKMRDDLNTIHCKAFGTEVGYRFESTKKNTLTLRFPQEIPPIRDGFETKETIDEGGETKEKPPALLVLRNKTTFDSVLMAIASFYKSESTEEKCIDIWSVAKNPALNYQNTFKTFLVKLKKQYSQSEYNIFNLIVDSSNTRRMTEQGRLRLYMSLGFDLLGGQEVETIYPKGIFITTGNYLEEYGVGALQLLNKATEQGKCDFIGNIKSGERTSIVLSASYVNLGEERDIYCGQKDSFKGKTFLVLTNDGTLEQVEDKNGLVANGSIDISSIWNNDIDNYTYFKTLYHMNLISKEVNDNNYIDFCQVPDDFIVFTITSPGSVLIGRRKEDKNEIEEYIKKIVPLLRNKFHWKSLLEMHRSTASLPVYNISNHELLIKNSEIDVREDTNENRLACERQLARSMFNSITMDRLGRQPIFEMPIEGEGLAWTASIDIKKVQYDIQIYTPGMRMFNYNLGRSSKEDFDLALNLGTAKIIEKEGGIHFEKQDDDTAFVDNHDNDFESYFDYIRKINPLEEGQMNVLFTFGCAPVKNQKESDTIFADYEVLYELSHRRPIVVSIDPGTLISDDSFFKKAFLGKSSLTEYNCPCNYPNIGGGRKRKERKKYVKTKKNKKTRFGKKKSRKYKR